MTGIRLIAVAAMLAGSVVAAVAQTSPTTTAAGAAVPGMTRCWDTAMERVLTETKPAPGRTAGSGSTAAPSNSPGASGSAAQTLSRGSARVAGLPLLGTDPIWNLLEGPEARARAG